MIVNRRQSVGVFTTDTALVVQSWDAWMAEVTGLSESAACGQRIVEDFGAIEDLMRGTPASYALCR